MQALRVLLADKNADPLPLETSLALADVAYHNALRLLARAWEQGEVLTSVASTFEEALEACPP